jgi:serine/threonine-protein kinase HipA
MDKLYIHYRGVLVGLINSDKGDFSFTYNEEWKSNGFEISPPLGFNKIENSAIKYFIENLLPEGNGLEELSEYFQISKSNKFAILKQMGLETTGAFTFSESEEYLVPTTFREITTEELEEKVKIRESVPIHIWDDKPRLSVAGVQSKLPLTILDSKIGFGEGDICSTHILKFNKKGENVILNEYISMKIAKEIGFNVAEVECNDIANEYVLYVERFDREIINDNLIARTHIIDSVQALNMPISYKYERNLGRNAPEFVEGVSFEKLFNLADKAEVSGLFKEQLIKWSIVNLILGNSDAHGKNISFFVSKKGLKIAPFYDIVNVTMYKGQYEQDMAMAIDDEFIFDEISEYNFREFFEINSISPILYFDEFKNTIKRLDKVFKGKTEITADEKIKTNDTFYRDYVVNVKDRVNRLSSLLNDIRYEMPFEGQTDSEFLEESIKGIKRILAKDFIEDDSDEVKIKKYLSKLRPLLIQEI